MKRTTLSLIIFICTTICGFAQTITKLEAENANYVSCTLIQDSKYSGGKALEITDENAKITFTYNQSEKGKYIVYVGYDGLYGDKRAKSTICRTPRVPSNSPRTLTSEEESLLSPGTGGIPVAAQTSSIPTNVT